MTLTIALILYGLGIGLRTLHTLFQVTGYPNYRVSIHSSKSCKMQCNSTQKGAHVITYFKIRPWWSSGQGGCFIVHFITHAKIPILNPAWDTCRNVEYSE